jgi:glycosyltransferase involved in cell wall biosynthesis
MTAVPLLHGAGMKSKLVQALMAATPTVTTTIGVEGMDLVDGEHVLIGDSPRRFADGITRVLTDDALWHQLADRGREQIMARFSSPVIERLFFEAIDDVMHDEPDPVTLVIGH